MNTVNLILLNLANLNGKYEYSDVSSISLTFIDDLMYTRVDQTFVRLFFHGQNQSTILSPLVISFQLIHWFIIINCNGEMHLLRKFHLISSYQFYFLQFWNYIEYNCGSSAIITDAILNEPDDLRELRTN